MLLQGLKNDEGTDSGRGHGKMGRKSGYVPSRRQDTCKFRAKHPMRMKWKYGSVQETPPAK